jgi:putative GTP pyrophosphokinase
MNIQKLNQQYAQLLPNVSRLKSALLSELGHLMSQYGVTLGVPMEARIKEWPSIEEKITRKTLTLDRITDLDDLVGIRIILLFRRDLHEVDRLIRESLTVLTAEDTAQRLTETQFGYQSQHYVVKFHDAWLKVPSYADFGEVKVEVQVRTLAQHIWAAASHKLQYKHESSVPAPLRRSIHRASALLETIDIEFDRLLEERLSYVQEQLTSSSPDDSLNVETLKAILDEMLPACNKGKDENYDELLIDLKYFNINTATKLRDLLSKHEDKIMEADNIRAAERNHSFFFQHVGLARQALWVEFGEEDVKEALKLPREKRISAKQME